MDEKERKEYLMKEVDTIQSIIKRMANNSFLIKGWTITLVVATLLLKGIEDLIFIAIIPLLVFWVLDSYFLKQERMYRELYTWVTENRLKSDEFILNMDASRFESNVHSVFRTMRSKTLGVFYVMIFTLVIIYEILICYFDSIST